MRILNTLYGIMRATLLFYEKFVRDLTSIRFKLNPYDPCVANKTVDDNTLTAAWHVNDLKASMFPKQLSQISWIGVKPSMKISSMMDQED